MFKEEGKNQERGQMRAINSSKSAHELFLADMSSSQTFRFWLRGRKQNCWRKSKKLGFRGRVQEKIMLTHNTVTEAVNGYHALPRLIDEAEENGDESRGFELRYTCL